MVWIYHDTTPDVYRAFDSFDAAADWMDEHDPEGVAFEYAEFSIVDGVGPLPEGWKTVLKDGRPIWHASLDTCARFVAEPIFREECLRSKQLKPGKP